MSILKSLDVMIGLAVIMLLTATVVTSLTHLYLRSTFTRSRNLRRGIIELLRLIDAPRLGPWAEYIAAHVLTHPSIARQNTSLGSLVRRLVNRLRYDWRGLPAWPNRNQADVIEREEFLLILLELAAGEGPHSSESASRTSRSAQLLQKLTRSILAGVRKFAERLGLAATAMMSDAVSKTTADAWRTRQLRASKEMQQALRDALASGGFENPETALSTIRARIVANERALPNESAAKWRALAFTEGAVPGTAAKVFAHFDSIVTRTGTHYGFHAKVASSMIALGVCLAMQLDALQLVRRLDQDDEFRNAAVARQDVALRIYEQAAAAKTKLVAAQSANGDALKIATQDEDKAREELERALADAKKALGDPDLKVIPDQLWWSEGKCANAIQKSSPSRWTIAQIIWPPDWNFSTLDSCTKSLQPHLAGILLSWVMVSLGSPFWYDLLKRLSGLRSILAVKEEANRKNREESQAQPQAATATSGANFGATLNSTPGLVRAKSTVRLRVGNPATTAEAGETLEAGAPFSYAEVVSGESLSLPASGSNQQTAEHRWYKSLNDEYLWAGDATPLQT